MENINSLQQVNIQFYKREKDPEKQIPEMIRVIDGHIRAIGRENCDTAILEDPRGEVGFHLASERKTTVSWYPFEDNARILEVGGDFGAITGALCDKAAHVVVTERSLFRAQSLAYRYRNRKNLEVYAGEVEDMEFPCRFDYIVLVSPVDKLGRGSVREERYLRAMESFGRFLKTEGKLLISTENLYSLDRCQQQDGALNPWTHIPRFSQNSLKKLLQKGGFPYVKFYYPLPWYHLVGRVYSEEVQPTAAEWNCLAHSASSDQNFLSTNMQLIQDLTENGLFTHYAPALFAEACKEDRLSDIKTADGLFDASFELPMLGFDWKSHGYSSLNAAIETYRSGQADPIHYERQKQIRGAIYQIDQDHEVLEGVLEVEFDLLKQLLQVCDRHGLKVYAIYGTLLGAVRCGGVIPGDDDIDVALMREDYDKLVSLEKEFTGAYFLQTPGNDDCFFGGYLKLRNCNTSAIHPQNWWTDCCEGIGIDIFPLDSGYADAQQERKKRNKIRHYQRLLYAKAYGYYPDFKDMKLLKWKAYKYWGKLFTRQQLADKLNAVMRSCDGSDKAPFGIYAHYGDEPGLRELDRNAFKKSTELFYECVKLNAPKDWDKVLRSLYGDSYMEPIPWRESKRRHGFYDLERPYPYYKAKLRTLLRPAPESGRKVVLFGEGLLFASFMKYYGNRVKPELLVMLGNTLPQNMMNGCPIISFEEFVHSFGMDKENGKIYPVICALDIRSAVNQLEAADVHDFYIYLQNREWMQLANPTCALDEIQAYVPEEEIWK